MQDGRAAARFSNDFGSVMAADIVESAQLTVRSADRHNGFAGYRRGHKLPGFGDLLGTPDNLPAVAENRVSLKLCNAGIDVPRPWNRGGFCQRRLIVVAPKDLINRERYVHHCLCSVRLSAPATGR